MEWATHGLVVPHVSQTIDSTVEAINAGLQSLKAGPGHTGKDGGDRGSQPGRGEVRVLCLLTPAQRRQDD